MGLRTTPRRRDIDLPAAVSESDMDDDARVGLATLEELLAKMQIEAEVAVSRAGSGDEDTPWVLQIAGAISVC